MARLVTVMPTWAPESWVESDAQRRLHAGGRGVAASAARSTWLRSTVTKANSAATNMPHAATSSNEMASRIVAVIVAPMLPSVRATRPAGRADRRATDGDHRGVPVTRPDGIPYSRRTPTRAVRPPKSRIERPEPPSEHRP